MSHTPGPWEVFAETDNDGEVIANVGRHHRPPGGEQHVCKIHTWGAGYEYDAEAQANARLIAAAPDLLAALYMAREEIHHPGAARSEGKDIAAILDAAIAKTTGEA